jgi:enamine deaminase RidA (YjgF/YER057c/UK114 family)
LVIQRTNVSTDTPWEKQICFSRAVRKGPLVFVSGTVAADAEGNVVAPGDPYAQTVYIFQKIRSTLNTCGADLKDVVRTRMYVVDMDHWPQVGKAHAEYFGKINPAATMVQVSKFVGPDFLVEIEVDAVVDG